MSPRTPQQRDRRFARVRRLTQTILIGAGVVSGVLVGYIASTTKPAVTIPVTAPPATTIPATGGSGATTTAPAAGSTPPTTAPVTTTTVCTTTPSGRVTCY